MPADPFGFTTAPTREQVTHPFRDRVIDAGPTDASNWRGRLATPAQQFPLRILLALVAVAFAILLGRAFVLQVMAGGDYRAAAEGNRIHREVTKALRGVIYDANGELLVKNVPNFELLLHARELPHPDDPAFSAVSEQIRSMSQQSSEDFTTAYEQSIISGQAVPVREDVAYTDALQLMIESANVPGTSVEVRYGREYLTDSAFSHILGYTGKITAEEYASLGDTQYLLNDDIGKAGLEASYETALRGEDGYREIEVDYQGNEKTILSDTEPIPGETLHLTLDAGLQRYLYERLAEVVDAGELPGASAVALDPRTGGILALVSYPAFDNNKFATGISQADYDQLANDPRHPLFHRAISGTFPSGSTFKPIVAAAGLEEGIVTPSTTVNSTGGLQIDRFFFPDWKAGGHGITNITRALADSVNTYFYLLGGGDNETTTGLGVDRIVEYARRFGLASPLGIDLPGEAAGFLPTKGWKEEVKNEPWYIGDTYHLAIGQGDILVTPLQVAAYTAVFANGGTLYRPHLVDHMTTANGEAIASAEENVINEQVVSPSSVVTVRAGLREAVLDGSARSLQSLPVSSAGKTGTAQFGDEEKTHAWFTAFAPYETPEIVVTVLAEEGGGGNDTAVPVARDALQYYFSRD
jgi:penicillin-binding protein 2